LVSRLTEQDVTPGTFDTAFSTLALQAAQLMPVTLYCFMIPSEQSLAARAALRGTPRQNLRAL